MADDDKKDGAEESAGERLTTLPGNSPLDTLPSGGGADLGALLGEQAEAVKAAVAARRAQNMAAAESATGDFAALALDEDAPPQTLESSEAYPSAKITGFEATAVASIEELKAAENARVGPVDKLFADSQEVFEDNDPTAFEPSPRATIMTPPGATPPGGGGQTPTDDPDSMHDVVIPMTGDIFEEESESTVYTPYQEVAPPGAMPPQAAPAGLPAGLPSAANSGAGDRLQSSESTAFDDPELKSIRDRLMKEAKDAKVAAQIQQSSVPLPTQVPDDGLRTMVDTQLSEEELRQFHLQNQRKANKATDVEQVAGGQGLNLHLRHCECETLETRRAIVALQSLQSQGGRALFVLLGFLIALGGSAAALKWGLVRLGHMKGVLGIVFLGVGVGVMAGACLSIRARDGQQNKLLFESLLLAALGAGALGCSLLIQGLNFFQIEAMGIALQQPWGAPFVREALLWFVCLQTGLIGGWSFRLKSNSASMQQDLPEYSEILGEFRDPDAERTGRSYNDLLVRSKDQVSLFDAAGPGSQGVKCFYCFRDATTLCNESEGKPWQTWFVGCPHCNEKLCIQHFAENAWQCRSCGKAIRANIKRCTDCPPGNLPDGQRALLCPHCHQWKGCADHIKARGGQCPVCSQDIKAYAEAYGRL